MIYFSTALSAKATSTAEYRSRGLSNMSIARPSDLGFHGTAPSQVAFASYKDGIEAFLYATAVKSKVTVGASCYPIPADYSPSAPIDFPSLVFRLSKKPTPEGIEKMKTNFKDMGITEVKLGKGEPSFTLERPTWDSLAKIKAVATPRTGNVENFSQAEVIDPIRTLIRVIDLFLATNTYYFKQNEVGIDTSDLNSASNLRMELRVDAMLYRSGYTSKSSELKKTKLSDHDKGTRRKIDDEEKTDLTPHRAYCVDVDQAVLVAKPSHHPSKISWGTPSECPKGQGILFPYFSGMIAPDARSLRASTTLFLRNFGADEKTMREAFSDLRAAVGQVVHTPQGLILTHIMEGIRLSLETQTHLFLLFDGRTYLGFVLRGVHFQVFAHGRWHEPDTQEKLTEELGTILTHESALRGIVAILEGGTNEMDVDTEITEEILAKYSSSVKLSRALSTFAGDDTKTKQITRLLGAVTFPGEFRRFSPTDIEWAIQELTVRLGDAVPEDLNVFIPLTGWKGIGSKVSLVLASFGSHSFSFRNVTGTEFGIPKGDEKDIFEEKDGKGQVVYPALYVMEKPLSVAVQDWQVLVEGRKIRMDLVERARGSRNHTFKGEQKEKIWKALKDGVIAGVLGSGVMIERPLKRAVHEAFGTETLDDLF